MHIHLRMCAYATVQQLIYHETIANIRGFLKLRSVRWHTKNIQWNHDERWQTKSFSWQTNYIRLMTL